MAMHVHGASEQSRRGGPAARRVAVTAALALCVSAAMPVLVTQAQAAAPADDPATAIWQRLAECESGANWQADTGNGYYGGLQFDGQTWQSYGGDRFAVQASGASPREQISIGEAVREDRGNYAAWPACARKLGLPT